MLDELLRNTYSHFRLSAIQGTLAKALGIARLGN